jgi:hypothetical protein
MSVLKRIVDVSINIKLFILGLFFSVSSCKNEIDVPNYCESCLNLRLKYTLTLPVFWDNLELYILLYKLKHGRQIT